MFEVGVKEMYGLRKQLQPPLLRESFLSYLTLQCRATTARDQVRKPFTGVLLP